MLHRPVLICLVALGLVAVGTGLAWLNLGQQDSATATERSAAVTPAQQAAVPPRAPVATAPAGVLPTFDVVRINPQGDAVMAGRAAPNTQVQILDGGKPIGTVTSDARGEWVFVPTDPLPPG